jgi:hypothetical protein
MQLLCNLHHIFADAEGYLNVIDREFKIYSFQAYRRTVTHVYQLKHSNILLTVGDDEEAISPTLKVFVRVWFCISSLRQHKKVWNLDKADKAGNPLCLRFIKIHATQPGGQRYLATCALQFQLTQTNTVLYQ